MKRLQIIPRVNFRGDFSSFYNTKWLKDTCASDNVSCSSLTITSAVGRGERWNWGDWDARRCSADEHALSWCTHARHLLEAVYSVFVLFFTILGNYLQQPQKKKDLYLLRVLQKLWYGGKYIVSRRFLFKCHRDFQGPARVGPRRCSQVWLQETHWGVKEKDTHTHTWPYNEHLPSRLPIFLQKNSL